MVRLQRPVALPARHLGQPEVRHHGHEAAAVGAAAAQQHVAGLEVAVDDAAGVEVVHALRTRQKGRREAGRRSEPK